MPDWHSQSSSPYILLILGGILLCAAVVWTCTGRARTRFHGWVYRAQEPTVFWLVVAVYYLAGVYFIGDSLYRLRGR